MKFALPLVFIFVFTFSIDAVAQISFVSATSTIKNNKQTHQKLRVKNSKQAAKIVKGRFGGKVLKVKKNKSGYRVKLIKTDGHIVYKDIDAKTGKIKGEH